MVYVRKKDVQDIIKELKKTEKWKEWKRKSPKKDDCELMYEILESMSIRELLNIKPIFNIIIRELEYWLNDIKEGHDNILNYIASYHGGSQLVPFDMDKELHKIIEEAYKRCGEKIW